MKYGKKILLSDKYLLEIYILFFCAVIWYCKITECILGGGGRGLFILQSLETDRKRLLLTAHNGRCWWDPCIFPLVSIQVDTNAI